MINHGSHGISNEGFQLSLQVCGGGAPECDGASTAAGVTHVTRGAAVMVGRRDNICAYSIYWVTYGYIYMGITGGITIKYYQYLYKVGRVAICDS